MFKFCKKPATQWTGRDVEEYIWQVLHKGNYSRSSRKVYLCAMAFVFKHVLKVDMGVLKLPPLPAYRKPLKIIPSQSELREIFRRMSGSPRMALMLMYGGGPRPAEAVELRVQDIDIEARSVRIHEGKFGKYRITVLPECLVQPVQEFIAWRRCLWEKDVAQGAGLVELPHQLGRKYKNAGREFRWQFLFPSAVRRGEYRWHMTKEHLADELKAAVDAAGIVKRITPHTMRHAFVTHGLEAGNDVRVMQDLCGHEDVNTTMGYNHADRARGFSPMDVTLGQRPSPVFIAPLAIGRGNLLEEARA